MSWSRTFVVLVKKKACSHSFHVAVHATDVAVDGIIETAYCSSISEVQQTSVDGLIGVR